MYKIRNELSETDHHSQTQTKSSHIIGARTTKGKLDWKKSIKLI